MKVTFSDRALQNLETIEDWIARDDPIRGASFVDELVGACEELAVFPLVYPRLTAYSGRPLRKRTYGAYLIVYDVADHHIEIVAIVHARRDLEALFD